MTTANRLSKPYNPPRSVRLPDPEPWDLDVTTFEHVLIQGYPAALIHHLGNPESTIVISETGASLRPTTVYADVRFPDLLIAFDVDPDARRDSNGYIVSEQGKPPDFVLEVASYSTGRNDETVKRDYYETMGVCEYWRFDSSGGQWHSAALAGDVLADGVYQPISVEQGPDGIYRGYSAALRLELHWDDGNLRWWDPVGKRYLETHFEVIAAREEAEDRAEAAETRAAAAEERVQQLEAELRRQQSPD